MRSSICARYATALLAFVALAGCGSSGDGTLSCDVGTELCACRDDGACDAGLSCYANLCVPNLNDGDHDADVDQEPGAEEPTEQETNVESDIPAELPDATDDVVESADNADSAETADEEGVVGPRYTCAECHTNKDLIKADIARRPSDHVKQDSGGGCAGSVSRLEPSQAVLVRQSFLDNFHGKNTCVSCHGGVEPAANRDEAHAGTFVAEVDIEAKCSGCHSKFVKNHPNSLHAKFNGLEPEDPEYIARAAAHFRRVTNSDHARELLAQGIEKACAECHRTTCGSCHITMPEPAGGGFPNTGHVFYRKPNTVYNCTACHGSRKSKEFLLSDVDSALVAASDVAPMTLKEDVHYQNGKGCADCHGSDWMHKKTENQNYKLRYQVSELRCDDCHVAGKETAFYAVTQHALHAKADAGTPHLQCQVCHSQAYPNCMSCHVKPSDTAEPPAEFKFYTFKIAKNPFKTSWYADNAPDLAAKYPYEYVLVRRPAPVYDTFDAFEPNILNNFTAYPTWKYATPHNIQKHTPQTANGCAGCHDDDKWYFTEDYLKSIVTPDNLGVKADEHLQKELEANAPIFIDRSSKK